ncbi:hypothetical protein ElyMa_003680000 [Elysia marginata]|uniref:Uncharacterized protein n=1 Tax=Elysia marginata TaxID=1093978 RepID=A0AAV4F0L3_9GAST|nr:hypothetical protein ElyMa_003680000 [Elysia marginata]
MYQQSFTHHVYADDTQLHQFFPPSQVHEELAQLQHCVPETRSRMAGFCECGSTINFPLGERSAQIVCNFGETPRDPMTFSLTVEGCLVPDMNLDESEPFGQDSGPSVDPF